MLILISGKKKNSELQNPYRKERIDSDGARHKRTNSSGATPLGLKI